MKAMISLPPAKERGCVRARLPCPSPCCPWQAGQPLNGSCSGSAITGFATSSSISTISRIRSEHFGDGRALGVKITFSVEETILGTAGGVKRVAHLFSAPIVVVYGDVLTDMDLGRLMAFHRGRGGQPHVTLSLCHAPNPWECGVVAVDGDQRVTRFVEKPPRKEIFSDLTNAGVLVIDPPILEHIPARGFCDISSDVLPNLLRLKVPVFAQVMEEGAYLIDIGTPDKYVRVQQEWPTTKAAAYVPAEN